MTDQDFPARLRQRAAARLIELAALAERTLPAVATELGAAAAIMRRTLVGGGTLFFCGNGGSAADAQHIAAEYVVRYAKHRRGLAAVALTTDTSILTAAGNDLGFDNIFARQVEALVGPTDTLVVHSTSGQSVNVLNAARKAREQGASVVAFTAGNGGALKTLSDACVVVPTDRTDRAQEIHLCLEHAICELIEEDLG